MTGGSITGNHAKGSSPDGCGGAVYVNSYSAFNMSGGEISGNSAEQQGGGVYCTGSGSVTLGTSAATSTVKIRNNTSGSSNATDNVHLQTSQTIAVAGALSTESEIGITRTYSSAPFTTGYASTNSGTAPNEIFTSDRGYIVIEGASGEATFTMNNSGAVYMPNDYVFTFEVNTSTLTLGSDASVTVTPTIKRNEANGSQTDLYYNPTDQMLYLDSAFNLPAADNNTVSWSASLLCHSSVEYDSLTAGSGSNANTFAIPALTFEDVYTLHVLATYMGYTRDASFNLQCSD